MSAEFGRGGFAGAGYGLQGYYDMRDRRLTARERDEDRARELELRGIMDPIRLRQAELALDELERAGALDRYLHTARYPYETADLGMRRLRTETDEFEEFSPYRRRAAQRQDELGGYAVEQAAAEHPNRMDDAEDYGILREPRRRAAASRLNYMAENFDSNMEMQQSWSRWYDLEAQFNNAIAIAREMRDPTAIVSAYDKLVDDGQQVQIKMWKDRNVRPPERPKDKISVITPRTQQMFGPQGAVYEDFDAFLNDSERVFRQYLQQIQPRMGMGLSMGYGGRGRSGLGIPGAYGSNMRGGNVPAEVMNNMYIEQALADTPLGANLSQGELTMLALKLRKNGELMAPEKAARESYFDLVDSMIRAETQRFREPDLATIQANAADIVNRVFGPVDWMQGMTNAGENEQEGYDWRQRMQNLVGTPD